MPKQTCALSINNLRLSVNLGWPEQERRKKQVVVLNATIRYPKPMIACKTDHLKDTVCYDELIKSLKNHLAKKPYRLIESLGHDIYHLLCQQLPKQSKLGIRLTKYAPIKGLDGGVCFHYGEEFKA